MEKWRKENRKREMNRMREMEKERKRKRLSGRSTVPCHQSDLSLIVTHLILSKLFWLMCSDRSVSYLVLPVKFGETWAYRESEKFSLKTFR